MSVEHLSRVNMTRVIGAAQEENDEIVAECIRGLIARELQIGGDPADIDLMEICYDLSHELIVQRWIIALSKGPAEPAYTAQDFLCHQKWLFIIDDSHEYNADILLKEDHNPLHFPKRSEEASGELGIYERSMQYMHIL